VKACPPRALFCAFLFVVSSLFAGETPVAIKTSARIGDGIVEFVPAGYDRLKTPSLALVAEPRALGEMPNGWRVSPMFFSGEKNRARVAVGADTSLYGTGEVTGPLLRNGKTVELWNTDNFNYRDAEGLRLYQTHPWVLGVRADGSAFGLLFDTTWRGRITAAHHMVEMESDGPPFRVIVIDRESPLAVLRGLGELTGTMPLPPRWALGFQQCRYSYFPDARARQIADEFRSRKIPCDVIWFDIDYMNGFRIFTFNSERYPHPDETNSYLHAHGFHSVWMIDPGVKAEPGYAVYDSGERADVFVKKPDGSEYHGEVWPGTCAFPDFTRPETRAWWGSLYKDFVAKGVDGVWNDMNEPAVFNTTLKSMPPDNQHRGGGDLPPGPHAEYHNVFGMLMSRATREGILAARPDKRPFVLTRSTYLGGQRYAATWTGDNAATWEYLCASVPMSLTLGLSGQPFSGPDIGGYAGKYNDPDLFGHWIAVGALLPFSRAHAETGSPNKEPWEFGGQIENVARTALDRRYRLLPYYYTLFHESAQDGAPVMRPVFFADPKDPKLRAEDRAFLLGGDLLVIPRWARDVKLPAGTWRDVALLDGNTENDGYQCALKIRPGAIVPLGKVVQNTTEKSLDPLTLLVSLDATGSAAGALYDDAGDGFDFKKGDYSLAHFTAQLDGNRVTIKLASREGNRPPPAGQTAVQLVTDSGVLNATGDISAGITLDLSSPHAE